MTGAINIPTLYPASANLLIASILPFNLEVPNSKQTLLFLKTYHCSEHRMIYENM